MPLLEHSWRSIFLTRGTPRSHGWSPFSIHFKLQTSSNHKAALLNKQSHFHFFAWLASQSFLKCLGIAAASSMMCCHFDIAHVLSCEEKTVALLFEEMACPRCRCSSTCSTTSSQGVTRSKWIMWRNWQCGHGHQSNFQGWHNDLKWPIPSSEWMTK